MEQQALTSFTGPDCFVHTTRNDYNLVTACLDGHSSSAAFHFGDTLKPVDFAERIPEPLVSPESEFLYAKNVAVLGIWESEEANRKLYEEYECGI